MLSEFRAASLPRKGSRMDRLEYFKARLDATMSPVDVMRALKVSPNTICVVDVRNGPAELLKQRIVGAIQLPESLVLERLSSLPRDRTLVLYCWDTWCSLATQAAVLLIEKGFDVKELYGGVKAWTTLKFPMEPVDSAALEGQSHPI
jgi:rhodanese-related sulfurtransferase